MVASRYRLDESIGQGGMGRVWRAVDEMLDRRVAVKEMRIDGLDPEDARTRRERTLREARATARIDHPGVVRVYDVVDQGERLWIVMELVDGRSLEQILVEDGPLPVDEVARIGLSLAGALRQVHAGGVLHRDIKPGNVLIERVGQRRVMLTDFGIAAIQDAKALTMVGMLVGSPDYMAPERISGRPQGPPSDLWSLGATLCAALGGSSPFSRDTTLATLHAVLYEEPHLPPDAGRLGPLLAGLLAKEPQDRPDVDTVTGALAPAEPPPKHPEAPQPGTRTLDIGLRRPAPAPAPARPRPANRRRTALIAAGGALAVGLAVALALTLPDGDPQAGGSTPTTSRPPTVEGTSRPPTESLPAGARREAGYAWVPPKGWERVVKTASEVHYTSPDGTQELVAQSALAKDDLLATWQKSERAAHQGQDYKKLRLTRTTFRGRPAVVWEYLFTLKGARWHAELLGFDRGSRSFQVGTWYRPEVEERARATYERVKETFTITSAPQSSPAGD
ncbi:serine/threonine-protein kinase [Streptomyces endophyticus]|uniref:non-specific serine/threonine protein kinase n=2 Tax=Streptomyces endophyticus TaxID=714166 RepID=A0ABU6FGA0_9ACTN|nr:serine/threonine-protein kinase [Streptomyces endophyticus]MEB8342978.1 serine/threonine protein kinase [Streptomyces endophyticus]